MIWPAPRSNRSSEMNLQVRGYTHMLNPDARTCAQDLSHSSEMNLQVRGLTRGQAKGNGLCCGCLALCSIRPDRCREI